MDLYSFIESLESMPSRANPAAENQKLAAIRNGLKTRFKMQPHDNFWLDFIRLCGDSSNLAHLLGVDESIIKKWPKQINYYLDMVMEEMDNSTTKKKRNFMMSTGNYYTKK